ncbi:hypothetical protein EGW08_012198 [Elysia chlorotica]|uniref:Uncharacterized protein n=1 Tax=Elysia chlorotica TaxID=188477 RepID=A0A433TEN7_ELYCH|nr:hypothetical protein EGW08_012198 [Elysia chlorotica]
MGLVSIINELKSSYDAYNESLEDDLDVLIMEHSNQLVELSALQSHLLALAKPKKYGHSSQLSKLTQTVNPGPICHPSAVSNNKACGSKRHPSGLTKDPLSQFCFNSHQSEVAQSSHSHHLASTSAYHSSATTSHALYHNPNLGDFLCHPSGVEMTDFSYFSNVTGTNAPAEVTLNSHIGKVIEKILTDGLNIEILEKLPSKYPAPSNCTGINVKECNAEVLKSDCCRARFRDLSLQGVQRLLTIAHAFEFEEITARSDNDILREKISDGVAFLTNASHSLDVPRRQFLKGEIKKEDNSLCQGTYPVTGSLFRPNLSEKIKALNETLRGLGDRREGVRTSFYSATPTFGDKRKGFWKKK